MDPKFPRIWKLNRAVAGSGSHHELNSHLIDLALYLVGKLVSVVGMEQTFIKERPAPVESGKLSTMLTAETGSVRLEPVDVDDTTLFLARFANGSASRLRWVHWSRARSSI